MAKNLEIAVLLDLYGDMLTEKQRDFLGYYYNDDLSLSEIAENEGITRQGVRDAIKRAEAQLFDMLRLRRTGWLEEHGLEFGHLCILLLIIIGNDRSNPIVETEYRHEEETL